jgi:hypothetical protein
MHQIKVKLSLYQPVQHCRRRKIGSQRLQPGHPGASWSRKTACLGEKDITLSA